jgi:hypothetical protein
MMDLELIDQMLGSRGWQLYSQRIERTIQGKMSDLARDVDQIQTAKLRGFIEALMVVQKLPAILKAEARRTPTAKEVQE